MRDVESEWARDLGSEYLLDDAEVYFLERLDLARNIEPVEGWHCSGVGSFADVSHWNRTMRWITNKVPSSEFSYLLVDLLRVIERFERETHEIDRQITKYVKQEAVRQYLKVDMRGGMNGYPYFFLCPYCGKDITREDSKVSEKYKIIPKQPTIPKYPKVRV